MKTFDPAIDGNYQDECGCDKPLSCWCRLSKDTQVCSCACHIEMADDAMKQNQKLRAQLTTLRDAAVEAEMVLDHALELDFFGEGSTYKMATSALTRLRKALGEG